MSAAKLGRIDPVSLADNPRATLQAWQRYEPIVIAAVRKFPLPFVWSPSPHQISCTTVVSRIRDACRGKIAFDYPSSITAEDLARWFSQVIFKVVSRSVYIGPKEQLKTVVIPLDAHEEKKGDLVFDDLTPDELNAFALLLSNGRLSGPIILRKPLSQPDVPEYPNFHIIPRPDGSLVLL
jgi:hypothetical protein